ncbi:MAG: LacI family DNA-binding transcriptional regulator [Armatimonadota bacterium]|nr:LacI family transcriptional regulator [bacterium]
MNDNITIQDVARDTNLSTATISRALNQPELVKQKTLSIVRESIARLGYKPNVGAQLLARGKSSKTICFLLSNRQFFHTIHANVLQGAANQAEVDKASVLYTTCNYLPDDMPSTIGVPHILATRGLIDGVIIAGTNYPNIIPVLDEIGLPYVIFGTNFIDGDVLFPASVNVDDMGGGYQATRHLIELGHVNIKFVGDMSFPWYKRRYYGYVKAVTEAGLFCEAPIGSASDGEFQMGFDAVNELCANNAGFSAIFGAGDEVAMGAIRALQANGRSVPSEVSVVGFNDEESIRFSSPQLTTVALPKEEVGSECVRMLRLLIENPGLAIEPLVLPTQLVVRESTCKEHSIEL